MSTFVLKRNYGLELPRSYVEVDRDEMEYVDGGGYSKHWWGFAIDLNVSECQDLSYLFKTSRNVLGLGTILTAKSVVLGPVAIATGISTLYVMQMIDNLDQGIRHGGATLSMVSQGSGYMPYVNPFN